MESMLEKFNKKWVLPFFAIVSIVYGFIFKIQSDELDQTTKKLENVQRSIETELKKKEFENNLKLTIYKEVKEAISSDKQDTILQKATLVVVNEMLKEDTAFREKLRTILFSSVNAKTLLKVQEKMDDFQTEQTTIESNNGYRIDVFYLDDLIKE